VHDFGHGHASLEPVFVPRSGGTDEDGHVLRLQRSAQR
jgi:carotenoid cleavage dioxygenase-like enzyme